MKRKFKYNFDRSSMKKIDTQEKAYFLGWIATDGCITHKHTRLELNSKDEYIIKYLFQSVFGKNIPPIRRRKTNDKFNKKLNVMFKGSNLSLGLISSIEVANDIKTHLHLYEDENKTYNVKFPILASEELYWSFLRGVFEGDGSISKLSNNDTSIRIWSASYSFIISMYNFLTNCNIISHINIQKNKLYILSIYGYNARIFLTKIYNMAKKTQRLDRKYKISMEWINKKFEQDKLSIVLGSAKKSFYSLNKKGKIIYCPICKKQIYVSPSKKRITCSYTCRNKLRGFLNANK